MNPRVAVGDERLSSEEQALYGDVNGEGPGARAVRERNAAAGRRQHARAAIEEELEASEDELDELGSEAGEPEYDFTPPEAQTPRLTDQLQELLESTEFSAPAPEQPLFASVAPLKTRARTTPTPAPQTTAPGLLAPSSFTALRLADIAIEDTDRIWDWVRADVDRGQAFFGAPLANSMALHDVMRGFVKAEELGTAAIRSIYHGEQHLGLVALVPILSTERLALVHAYFGPAARPHRVAILPHIIALCIQLLPGYHLGMMALGDATAYGELLTPLGFKPHTLFIR